MPESNILHRPAAFWAINGLLEDEELIRQIEEFQKGGYGGFFLHARAELKTPYLSQLFMDKIQLCVETAEKFGMNAWLYDEKDWPSGTAGGQVYQLGSQNRAIHLVRRKLPDESMLPCWGEVARADTKDGPVAFYVEFGIGANELSEKTTKDFIALTHERYKERVGHHFGKTVPGVFFDEPHYGNYYEVNNYIPWCQDFPEAYEAIWHEPILPHLNSLFADEGDFERIRVQFWHTVSELYAARFGKPIYDWCGENGLISTGHYECEEDFYCQIRCTGSLMRQYEYIHWPGSDSLGRGMFAPWIFLESSSVSAQLGKARTMTECFGVGGQNMNLHDRRWMYGMLMALGHDYFVPHISWYSLRGYNKRDCPPHNQYHQPWWHYGKPMEDSVARAVGLLEGSRKTADTLVLFPLVTAWSRYAPGQVDEIKELQVQFEGMFRRLLDDGHGFHLGEEMLMEQYARVESGALWVGLCRYDTVILPHVSRLLPKTRELLAEFAASGGTVLMLGRPVEGVLGREIESPAALSAALRASKPAVLTSESRIWQLFFEKDGISGIFVSNPERDLPLTVTFHGDAAALWDTEHPSQKRPLQNGETFTVPSGGFAFVLWEEVPAAQIPAEPAYDRAVLVKGPWALSSKQHLSEFSNVATLDECKVTANGVTEGRLYTRRAYPLVMEAAKEYAKANPLDRVGAMNLRFTASFAFVNESDAEKIVLCVEDAPNFRVFVNGQEAGHLADGTHFLDASIRRFDISGLTVRGENTVELAGATSSDMVLEDIYLLGDFSVWIGEDGTRILKPPVTSVWETAGLEGQGLPFLAGNIKLTAAVTVGQPFARAKLLLENPRGAAFSVRVNGEKAGDLIVSPWETDISSLLVQGENTVEIEVVNTLRNLLGPLHNNRVDPISEGPGDFDRAENWSDLPVFAANGFDACRILLAGE